MGVSFLLLPMTFGWLVDKSQDRDHGYRDPLLMQSGVSLLSILFNLTNYWYDRVYNSQVLALDVESRNRLFATR